MHRWFALITVTIAVGLLAGCNLTRGSVSTVPDVTEIPLVLASPTFLFDSGSITLTAPGGVPPVTGPLEGINPNCPAPPGWAAYTVEPGDSMGLLAAQSDSTIAELVSANCLNNPDEIFVGQVLFLPRAPTAEG